MYTLDKFELNFLTSKYAKSQVVGASITELGELLIAELKSLIILSITDHPLFPTTCTLIVSLHRINSNQVTIIIPKSYLKLIEDAKLVSKHMKTALTVLNLIRQP